MRAALLIVFALLLAGCGSTPTTGTGAAAGTPAPVSETTAPAETVSPVETAAAEATLPTSQTAAPAALPLPAGSVEANAAEDLSVRLNLGAGALQLTAKEAVEWSDGSLGCPVPGMMYTQAIIPGYKLTYSDGSKSYVVHTDESGERVVLCENMNPVELVRP